MDTFEHWVGVPSNCQEYAFPSVGRDARERVNKTTRRNVRAGLEVNDDDVISAMGVEMDVILYGSKYVDDEKSRSKKGRRERPWVDDDGLHSKSLTVPVGFGRRL